MAEMTNALYRAKAYKIYLTTRSSFKVSDISITNTCKPHNKTLKNNSVRLCSIAAVFKRKLF